MPLGKGCTHKRRGKTREPP